MKIDWTGAMHTGARQWLLTLVIRSTFIPIPIAPSPSKKRGPSNLATDGRHYEQYEDQRPSGM